MSVINIGAKFNNFTVIAVLAKRDGNGEFMYQCKCICGAERDVRKSNLGKVLGCGCVRATYKPRTTKPSKSKPLKTNNSVVKDKLTTATPAEDNYLYQPTTRQRIEDLQIDRACSDIYDF